MLLPVPGEEDEIKRLRALFHKDAHARSLVEKLSPKHESHAPLTLFQKSLVQLADRLNNDVGANLPARAGEIIHEHEAALHVHESITRFLEDK